MRIDIISVLPDLLQSPLQHSILQRAQEKKLLEVHTHNLRDYAINKHGQVDDYQYGGGAGMVLMAAPIAACIEQLKSERVYDAIIYLTPDAPLLAQKDCNRLSLLKNIILLCGHYKGIDHRIREMYITAEFSIGSYVLSGGEIPALVLTDAIGRLIPGVLNDETSALTDSFQDDMLSPPVYTRPVEFNGVKVPEVLTSGNTALIETWRYEQALLRTKLIRPDLLKENG